MSRSSSALLFSVLATLVFLNACKSKDKDAAPAKGGRQRVVAAEAYIVKLTPFAPVYTASGQLLANEAVEIHPEVSGRVTGLYFHEGSHVRKGQLLVQLNDADVRAQIGKLKAQRALQQSTQARQEQLLRIGGISRQDYEATQTEVKSVNADIAVAEANLARLRILAPFDGTIGLRNISIGAIVSPTTVVATLQQTSSLKLDFAIPDQYRSYLQTGENLRFYVEGMRDTLRGKISAMDPGADPVTHTLRVRALVPNEGGKLLPGAFAHDIVPFGSKKESILIPSQCIIPTTRDKKVALLRDGKVTLQTVQTGDRTSDRVQIIQGLDAGDTILTTALMQVKEGMEVKLTEVQ
jgi:membrane fusion protein (multidrug efflux system)